MQSCCFLTARICKVEAVSGLQHSLHYFKPIGTAARSETREVISGFGAEKDIEASADPG